MSERHSCTTPALWVVMMVMAAGGACSSGARIRALQARVAALEQRLAEPPQEQNKP